MINSNADIVLIAAIGKNRELGIGPALVWRLKEDLKRFKALTTGHAVIMGRKTFDSIGKPLPDRINIVVTRDINWSHEDVVVAHSLEEAFSYSHKLENKKIYVIGGGEIYTQALLFATHLELTHIESEESRATVFFPAYEHLFEEVTRSEIQEESGVQFEWVTYKRK